jgi:hypothetical protein
VDQDQQSQEQQSQELTLGLVLRIVGGIVA